MDAIHAIKQYIEKIVGDPKMDGMKVLLLDDDTKRIISMVYSQSEILEKDVFLVESLGVSHERMTHLKAAVFIRPTAYNLETLKRELKDPKYGEYHIYFSNIVPPDMLERLAEVDELEVIRQVQELYADYLAVNSDLFYLNLPQSLQLSHLAESSQVMSAHHASMFNRTVEGILASLLSLKKKPIVRYQDGAPMTRRLASEVSVRMQRDGLFDFRRPDTTPVLLILDRKDDPVTPLLSQWSYQAMVHELIGLFENRVDLKQAPGIRKELEELVLSVTADHFFADHKCSNFGDLGMAVKKLVDQYQSKAQTHENIESIEDMQRFVENYPAFRSESLTVSKHVALMGELSRLIEVQDLMNVSQFEQELACSDERNSHYKELLEKLSSGQIRPMNKARLAMLYALRYETHSSSQIGVVKSELRNAGVPNGKVQLLDIILSYGGAQTRAGDLYGDRGLKKYMRAMTQGLQGVPNVYAQHVPPLIRTVENLLKGQLSESAFPVMSSGANVREKPRDVIVFITGGVTFEEAEKIAELNSKSTTGQRVLLGGSFIHNSTSFLGELHKFADSQDNHMIQMDQERPSHYAYDGKAL